MPSTVIATQRHKPQTDWLRLVAAAAISFGVLLGLSASAQAELLVSLQQVDENGTRISSVTANPNPALQTLTYANLVVSGSGSPLPVTELFGFATVVSWTADVPPGTLTEDLYTVNSAGAVAVSGAAMLVNEPGFLFDDPENSSLAFPDMNTTNLDPNSQRYVLVDNFEFNPTLSDPVGSITVARLRFAIAPGIREATFSFGLNGTGPQLGFSDIDANLYQFQSGGGSIVVVPEPGTVPAGMVGVVVIGGWMARRSRRGQAPLAGSVVGTSAA